MASGRTDSRFLAREILQMQRDLVGITGFAGGPGKG